MKRVLGVCLDWRVLAGLGAIALAIWLYAPQLLLAALPVLLVLACPISMGVMAWMMRGEMSHPSASVSAADRLVALEREQARLAAEIARARGELDRNAGPVEAREA